MLESIMAEIAYKCDLCGKLFKSTDDAQDHNQEAHAESVAKIESGSSIMGTGTPAEDREQERTTAIFNADGATEGKNKVISLPNST